MARILITGCSTGIGEASVRLLAGLGHEVIATARSLDAIDHLEGVSKLQLDVSDDASVAEAVAKAGPVDVLVNNAGISVWGPAELIPMPSVERVVNTNYLGVVRMTHAFLPQMRERRSGKIIQISSTGARRAGALLSIYASTKAAVDAYTLAVRQEMWEFGVHVCALGMTAIDSAFPGNRETIGVEGTPYERMADLAKARAARTQGTRKNPMEVAQAIRRLIDDPAPPYRSYVSDECRAVIAGLIGKTDEELDREMLDALYNG